METLPVDGVSRDAWAGAALYSRTVLSMYDVIVLGLSSRFIWRCPAAEALAQYSAHVSSNHLEVGVGTGYFLDHCRFPTPQPRLTLFDLNSNSLNYAARRLKRYAPAVHVGNVLTPLLIREPPYQSIGLNYVLHCLPGMMQSKAIVFDHLRRHLAPGGVLFGSTILRADASTSSVAAALMRYYNGRRIFSNSGDTEEDLRAALEARFDSMTVRRIGCVALFSGVARNPES